MNSSFSVTFKNTSHEYIVEKSGNIIFNGTKTLDDDPEDIKKELLEISSDTENTNTSAMVSNINDNILTIDISTLKLSNDIGNFEKNDKIMVYASISNTITNCRKI